ncbi:DUF2971 domain-containing protein [Rhizobium sp. VS19-DR104.2]|uniref:DUF2971 domain-containing protein n=1 Tax=unclassified Rhizobium TaxID=2613769 RepID=UPI001C5B6803|nr:MULTISPECIES: DUF2971 domain-containing protein [unclassified Rhizobium]MBZ5762887.1 DUF2971 domain-containing protein [Rhizobium sp. VS19-DR96]MBZ5768748.1 DUF2971 domain-containing protein [Rhizobium sp. VS19-DR129.2]MBZ5776321.1 DUF2971 domain-containing protein [Rhizobium sp. VS19-DRK62.2]MBZ5787486.1 DUF2971 domain-containing protein [Rhizobium sp. VS19-DR121]MBZ5804884.1 DUF2971 domain-containing protein [Rhizobium sp. VS19-DR181]
MILYKYRSLARESSEFTLDIIHNCRLYCAPWHELNDPMEGMFEFFTNDERDAEYLDQVIMHKHGYRVCSLSRTKYSHVMWAHYADQSRGVMIAVDVQVPSANLVDIYYRSSHSLSIRRNGADTNNVARKILSSKHKEWSYEKEVRILSDQAFFNAAEIHHVTLGIRTSTSDENEVIRACRRREIPLYKLRLGDEGLEERPFDEYQRAQRRRERW